MIYARIFRYCPVNESEDLVNWELLARTNTHPLRVSVMEVLSLDGGRTLSPKDLSLELQAPLSTVNYHVTELARARLIEIVRERQVRGAIEHFYRPVGAPGGKWKAADGTRTHDLLHGSRRHA
jgi:DNA-binding transcriptional ArsR family regulator